MRIIDKNYDYYDYLQDNEDTLVFDRRGSVVDIRDHILHSISRMLDSWYEEGSIFLLLQCGATYWLFLAEGKDIKREGPKDIATDYDLHLITTWKDYDRPYRLLSFEFITLERLWEYSIYDKEFKGRKYIRTLNIEKVKAAAPKLKDTITHKQYKCQERYDKDGYPLLKLSGIPNLVGPEEMYNAIDEYFSLMKAAAESTVAKGTTNEDKIKNHGFDVKASFRGGKKPR